MTVSSEKHTVLAGAFVIAATVCAAGFAVMARRAYDFGTTPETLAVLRPAIPAAISVVWVIASWRRCATRPDSRVLLLAVVFGLLYFALALLELSALERIPVAVLSVMLALMPLWISASAWLLWRRRLSRRATVSLAAAILGTVVMVGAPGGELPLLGVALALGASLAGAAMMLLYERTLTDAAPQVVLAVAATVATVAGLILSPHAFSAELGSGTSRALAAGGACVLIAPAMLLLFAGIRHSSAFVVGIALTVEPLAAGVLGWIVLSQGLTDNQIVGGCIAVGSVAFVLTSGEKAVPPVRERDDRQHGEYES